MNFTRGVEIAKMYTCPGQVNCYKLIGTCPYKVLLVHIKEQILHKDLSEALTVLKQCKWINSFKNSFKPDINH